MAADPIVAPRTRPRAPQRPRLRPAPPPRRVSGPQRATSGRPRTARASAGSVALPAPTGAPLARVLEGVRAIPDSRLLDRLIRGQGWIVIIGIALMGIVALQVSLLKMNTGIGVSIEKAGALERQNADLRAEVSRLSSEERITSEALKQDLVMPDAGEVRYVNVRGEIDARKAAAIMRPPDPVEETTEETTPVDPAATGATADPAAQATPDPAAEATTPTADPAAQTAAPATTDPAATAGATAGATAAPSTTAVAGQ